MSLERECLFKREYGKGRSAAEGSGVLCSKKKVSTGFRISEDEGPGYVQC